MLAAAAAHLALSGLGVPGVGVKWPNDLLVDGRKLAGVLVHVRHGERVSAAVGLGVNVTTVPTLEASSTRPPVAISELLPWPSENPFADWAPRLAGEFVDALMSAIEDPAPALARWRQAVVHRPGEPMSVRLGSGDELVGRFAGLSEDGFLRLELPGGERTITGGDVM
jgi:BirA family biotin operon repressor/biotin-[acetyl-CoA-carboxylase] ligase